MFKNYTETLQNQHNSDFNEFWKNANEQMAQQLCAALTDAARNGLEVVDIIKPESKENQPFRYTVTKQNGVTLNVTLYSHNYHNLDNLYNYLCNLGFNVNKINKSNVIGALALQAKIPTK